MGNMRIEINQTFDNEIMGYVNHIYIIRELKNQVYDNEIMSII